MDWRSPNRTRRDLPAGEYVVVHERPFPEKLDTRFRVAAAFVGALAGIAFAVLLFFMSPRRGPGALNHAETAAIVLGTAGTAYGAVRMVGMLLVGVSGLWSGKKRYSVEWQPASKGFKITEKAVVIAGVIVFALLLGIAKHQ